ncbi:MAG: head GIN domain-containing protein [Bacteroidota bacterium]
MRRIFFFLAASLILFSSCRWMGYKRIKGNGVIVTQDRHIDHAERITLKGSYNVEITQGATTSVKVEGDENILPFILVNQEGEGLVIRSKDHISYSTDHDIKIYITTDKLEQVNLQGSGNISGKTKFTGGDKLTLRIAGSGDIKMEVNTPSIDANISGSGSMNMSGETKDQNIHIAGVGNYNAENLKSESARVKIAGSGDVKIFADASLDINIAGVGSVFYKGNPTVKQHVAGSGEVKRLE